MGVVGQFNMGGAREGGIGASTRGRPTIFATGVKQQENAKQKEKEKNEQENTQRKQKWCKQNKPRRCFVNQKSGPNTAEPKE